MTRVLARGTRPPTFLDPMEYRASTTGVLKLKEGRYTSRYRVGPGYAVTGRGEIIVKPKDPAMGKTPQKMCKTISADPQTDPQTDTEKIRKYGINKQLVRARITAMVNMLISDQRIKNPKLYFWTVTFKAGTPDAVCYQLLNTWLTALRQSGRLLSYLWIAERQENGTVHYHLAVPHYMHHRSVNKTMRGHLFDLQKKGLLPGMTRAEIQKYNGVHIARDHKTKRIVNFAQPKKARALARYLSKYITKNETSDLQHFAWHCSRDWSALVLGMCFTRAELSTFVKGSNLDADGLQGEFATFYRWKNFIPPDCLTNHLARINYDILYKVSESAAPFLYCLN